MAGNKHGGRTSRIFELALLLGLLLIIGLAAIVAGQPSSRANSSASSTLPTPAQQVTEVASAETPLQATPAVPVLPETPAIIHNPAYPAPVAREEPRIPLPTALAVIPSYPGPEPLPTRSPPRGEPQPTPLPEEPFNATVAASLVTDIQFLTEHASMIGIGTVKEILGPRWSTPDGGRPANPHTFEYTIYKPVTIEVEQVVKGDHAAHQIRVMALGGQIGRDSVSYDPDLYMFSAGERVLLFLQSTPQAPTFEGATVIPIADHYTLTPDGAAGSFHRKAALPQLLQEIQQAMTAVRE